MPSIRVERYIPVPPTRIGTAPEYHDRIFRLFRRLAPRDRSPGPGTGLAIDRTIGVRHGGRARLESAEGGGSTFYFTIPADLLGGGTA